MCMYVKFSLPFWSHPVWVRGLKLENTSKNKTIFASHPVWVRGLKHNYGAYMARIYTVAPRVGAWIETVNVLVSHWPV